MAECSKDVVATPSNTITEESEPPSLSDAQRAKVERNRQRALLLRQSRLASRPYSLQKPDKHGKSTKLPAKPIDTGGGFLIEEEEDIEAASKQIKIVHPQGPVLVSDDIFCDDCGKVFMESYLFEHFDCTVCDKCREEEEKYNLMTKSDAKDTFLLKDEDLDKRNPPLKFIIKKNPRNQRWGDMKLYLYSQVYKRAMHVWGSEEKLEERREQRVENQEHLKQKRFDKKVKELRKTIRSSTWTKKVGAHEHVYGEESHNEEKDTFQKQCSECGHVMEYEKM